MPKRLLRGVIDFGDGKVSEENLGVNYRRLSSATSKSTFKFLDPDERKIYGYVQAYVIENHEQPSSAVIRDHFERSGEITVTEKLLDIAVVDVYTRTHYSTLLDQQVQTQKDGRFARISSDALEIASKGKDVGEGRNKQRLKGIEAAISYFNEHAPLLTETEATVTTAGDLRADVQDGWDAYLRAKEGSAYGKFLGIEPVDTVCHGIKPGELWIHAGFAGHLKTSISINWAYNTVTRYRGNVLYVSLEMPYEQLRRMVYTLHTSNGRFRAQGSRPLDYRKVRDGELNEDEESFYRAALKDFEAHEEHHRFDVWAPDRDVTIKDIRAYAERLDRQHQVDLIVIDHAGLVKSTERDPSYGVRLNSVFREAKLMALQFAKGRGVPVLALHQLNREGLKEADKNGGKYTLGALAWANEAERSADVVTTTYLNDELRARGETVMGNLKNRDNPLFAPATLSIDFRCRRLYWDRPAPVDVSEADYDAVLADLV